MRTDEKLAVLIGIMASSRYRVWWWTNYKTTAAQAEFKRLWGPVLARLTVREIREGMALWQARHDEGFPPSPELFADIVRPVPTAVTRSGFAGIKAILEG